MVSATKYFAYGSNMSPEVMKRLSPRIRFLSIARLSKHRLAFTRRSRKSGMGVADVLPARRSDVWGALYELDAADLEAIDRKEGYGWAYTRTPMDVRLPDDTREEAWVYRVISPEEDEVAPSTSYLDNLIRAAHERGLPNNYISFLEERRGSVFR